MRFRCIDLQPDGLVTVREVERPDTTWLRGTSPRWLDVEGVETHELRALLAPLGISPELLANFEGELRPTSGSASADWRAFRLGLPGSTGTDPSYLSLVFGPTIVVSRHQTSSDELTATLIAAIDGTRLPVPTLSGLVCHVLTALQEMEVTDFFELRDRLDRLSGSLDDVPDEVDVEAIVAMKRRIAALLSRCEDHIYATGWMWDLEQLGNGRLKESYRIMYQGLERFRSVLSRGERRLQDLHQQYLMTLQETTNSRLRVLTILSAIFMPMTLIAGVYGMNFHHMPELDEKWAYFAVLGAMGVLGLAMITFFWKKGWFD